MTGGQASSLGPLSTPSLRPGPMAGGLALAGVAAGLLTGSPTLLVGGPLAAGCAWHQRRAAAITAGRSAAADRTIELVAILLQHLKAGGSLSQALRAATSGPRPSTSLATDGRSGPDEVLARIRAAADAGAGLEMALARVAANRAGVGTASADGQDRSGVTLLVRTLLVLVQRGGPALPALERLDDTLRSARWVEQETAAQAGQATASALALAALPALFVAVLALLDADLARFYGFHPLGAACLAASALLAYAGWWWMHRIVAASLGAAS